MMDSLFADIFKDYKKPEKDIVGKLSDLWGEYRHWAEGGDDPLTRKGVEAFNKYSGLGGPGMIVSHGTPHYWGEGLKGKFDLSNLGKGEGGALFNRGAYLAQDPRLGNYYRDATTGQSTQAYKTKDGIVPTDKLLTSLTEDIKGLLNKGGIETGRSDYASLWARDFRDSFIHDVGPKQPYKDFEELLRWKINNYGPLTKEALQVDLGIGTTRTTDEFIDLLKPLVDMYTPIRNGYLYKLDLPDKEIARFLDLDSAISKGSQHPDTLGKLNDYIKETILNAPRAGNQSLYQNTSQGLQKVDVPDLYAALQDYKAGNRMTPVLGSNDYWSLVANPRSKNLVTLHPLGSVPGRTGTKPIGDVYSTMPFSTRVEGLSSLDRLLGKYNISSPADIRDMTFTGNDFQHWANQVNRKTRSLDTSAGLDLYGIKGNKFLDAKSRKGSMDYDPKHKPTRNFVVWNQDLLDKLKILQIRGLW